MPKGARKKINVPLPGADGSRLNYNSPLLNDILSVIHSKKTMKGRLLAAKNAKTDGKSFVFPRPPISYWDHTWQRFQVVDVGSAFKDLEIPTEKDEYVIPLQKRNGELVEGARITIDPQKIYDGLNKMQMLYNTATVPGNVNPWHSRADSYLANAIDERTGRPAELHNYIKEVIEPKNEAFTKFKKDHLNGKEWKNDLEDKASWAKGNAASQSYVGMFMGPGEYLAQSYLAFKKVLANPLIDEPQNSHVKRQINKLSNALHNWVEGAKLENGSIRPMFAGFTQGIDGYDIEPARQHLSAISVNNFFNDVAGFVKDWQTTLDDVFDAEKFDSDIQMQEEARRRTEELKRSIQTVTRNYEQAQSELSKTRDAYNTVARNYEQTQSELSKTRGAYNTVARNYEQTQSALSDARDAYDTMAVQAEDIKKQYKIATQQYNNTYKLMNKLKRGMAARGISTGDTAHVSYNFFKDVFLNKGDR